jgi:hypothetical protein
MARDRVFQVGDVVKHRSSKYQGRIVRIVNTSEIYPLDWKGKRRARIAYIVSLPGNRHTSVKEALWREDEIAPADCT